MNGFILPVTIESRKVLFLSLLANVSPSEYQKNTEEDTYIVGLPDTHTSKIISFPKNKAIQSLLPNIADLQIKDLRFEFANEPDQRVLAVRISKAPKDPNDKKEFELGKGLRLNVEEDGKEIRLVVNKGPEFSKIDFDAFTINFFVTKVADNPVYEAGIKIFLVHENEILIAGFDFGSEASQIKEGYANDPAPRPFDIFSSIKSRILNGKEKKPDIDYSQYESSKLYKSAFYLKKEIKGKSLKSVNLDIQTDIEQDDINVLTQLSESANNIEFYKTWTEIPNLKLIHDNPELANDYRFTIKSSKGEISCNLGELRNSIYTALLREIIHSYLNRIQSKVYLRFTLLVPNIYTIVQIIKAKQIVRELIVNSQYAAFVKGLEISTISESDSAFYGIYDIAVKKSPGQYFIIIDCGKGTTDFSIIRSDKNNAKEFVPIYRNGFAGAGNLISFGFMQSVLHFLQSYSQMRNHTKYYDDFIKSYLTKGAQNPFKHSFFKQVEKWKKSFNPGRNRKDVEEEWTAEKEGSDFMQDNLFAKTRTSAEIISHLELNPTVYDWNGHIASSVAEISGKIYENLAGVIIELNKNSKCGGILLSGRGFKFQPLVDAVKYILRSIGGLEKAEFLNNANLDLKGVCLDGVFTNGIIVHNDTAATPIEILNNKVQKKGLAADLTGDGIFPALYKWVMGNDESKNTLDVMNQDLDSSRFNVGGKIYKPGWIPDVALESANVICTRDGYYMRARGKDKSISVIRLTPIKAYTGLMRDEKILEKSLFPGWFDPALLNS